MSEDAFIQCRVTPAMKSRVRELVQRENITESALVKQLLEVVLRTSALADPPVVENPGKPNRDSRLYVRLDPEDRLLLSNRANARRMASATYVSVLVRAHLRNLSPLPKEELLALKRAIAELGAIGRNLNQMARALNNGYSLVSPGSKELRAMLQVAQALRDNVKGLLKANAHSWEVGRAKTSY